MAPQPKVKQACETMLYSVHYSREISEQFGRSIIFYPLLVKCVHFNSMICSEKVEMSCRVSFPGCRTDKNATL